MKAISLLQPWADGNGLPRALVVKEPAMIGGRLGLWEVQDGIIDLDGLK